MFLVQGTGSGKNSLVADIPYQGALESGARGLNEMSIGCIGQLPTLIYPLGQALGLQG